MTELRVDHTEGRLEVVATDDAGKEVGVAWCELGEGRVHAAWVEVDLPARGNGVGAALLERLIAEASALGVGYLVLLHDDVPAARRMEKASGAICSRRAAGGRVKDVIVVPRVA